MLILLAPCLGIAFAHGPAPGAGETLINYSESMRVPGGVVAWSPAGSSRKGCIRTEHLAIDFVGEWREFSLRYTVEGRLPGGTALIRNGHALDDGNAPDRHGARTARTFFVTNNLNGDFYPLRPTGVADILLGFAKPAVICGLRLQGRNAAPLHEVRVQTLAKGTRSPVRLSVVPRGANPGAIIPRAGVVPISVYLPGGHSVLTRTPSPGRGTYWPAERGRTFYVDGDARLQLSAGTYELIAYKGPEYLIARQKLVVSGPGQSVTLDMQRWVTMDPWVSGDVHIHIDRGVLGDDNLATIVAAESLGVANILRMGNLRHVYYDSAGIRTRVSLPGGGTLVPGQEDPRTAYLGHVIVLGLKQPIRRTGEYYNYPKLFRQFSQANGVIGFAHGYGEFNLERGLALTSHTQTLTFIEVAQGDGLGTELWYRLLNLGFKVAPAAGSDFPYFGLPGSVRSYVRMNGGQTWAQALQRQRTFVTNGPMLSMTLDGDKTMGDSVAHRGTQTSTRLHVRCRLNPTLGQLTRLDVVVNGKRYRSYSPGKDDSQLEAKLVVPNQRSYWVAATCRGRPISTVSLTELHAHTAPAYVHVDDEPTWERSEVLRHAAFFLEALGQIRANRAAPEIDQNIEREVTGPDVAREIKTQIEAIPARTWRRAKALFSGLRRRVPDRSPHPLLNPRGP